MDLAAWLAILLTWAFFETKNGYIGICPPLTQPGDSVCVLLDCKIPVILRKTGARYVHVGTCFALGFMDGEAMADLDAGNRSLQTFEIH